MLGYSTDWKKKSREFLRAIVQWTAEKTTAAAKTDILIYLSWRNSDWFAENGPLDRFITIRSSKRPNIPVEVRRAGREKVRKFEGGNGYIGIYKWESHKKD